MGIRVVAEGHRNFTHTRTLPLEEGNTVRQATCARRMCPFPPRRGKGGMGETCAIEARPEFTPTLPLPVEVEGILSSPPH
jgi:hypothetical protein